MAEDRQQAATPDAAAPDPEERSPAERRAVEHVSGFQGDKQQMPLDGDIATDAGGTGGALPPTSSEHPDQAERPA